MQSREVPVTFARHNLKAQCITYVNEVIPYVHYSWVVHIYICCLYYYSMYRACNTIACSELPVSRQEAVLGIKTPSPMTVLLERGEGFFRQLSRSHTLKKQIKRRKTGASNIQADADRCKQRQTVSLVDVTHSLDNNISPPKFIFIIIFVYWKKPDVWSAQPKCWPRPID